MHAALSWIWTQVINSISYDDNHYAKHSYFFSGESVNKRKQ